MALTEVPPGELATVVTTLERRTPPAGAPRMPPRDHPLRLDHWPHPDPACYRALFARVGGPWLWYSRLALTDAELRAAIGRPQTQVHAVVDRSGREVGLLEFTHPEPDWCALDYFALLPELVGQGHGRWLMTRALALMWRPEVRFVRVNTCTLDHPRALGFYQAHGFVAVARTVETFPDPRRTGLLPRDIAPQMPLI